MLQGPVGMAAIMIRILRKLFHHATSTVPSNKPPTDTSDDSALRQDGQLSHWQKLAKKDVNKQANFDKNGPIKNASAI